MPRLRGECLRSALPPADRDEFYITDLIGLDVVSSDGRALGVVQAVHDYGAGASLEISQNSGPSLLIPFTASCVPTVDIDAGRIVAVPPDEIIVPQENAA